MSVALDIVLCSPTIQSMTDEETEGFYEPDIELLRANDGGEWEKVVEAYAEAICRLLRSMYNLQKADLEDICQETLKNAVTGIGDFEDGKKFATWIFMIARRRGIDFLRRKMGKTAANPDIHDSIVKDDDDDGPDRELASEENDPLETIAVIEKMSEQELESALIREAITTIGEPCKSVLSLFYFTSSKTEDIAKTMNTAPGTVRSRLDRCRGKLREIFMRLRQKYTGNAAEEGDKE